MTPTPRLVQITAWSYSRYSTYNKCPFKAKCSIIDKLKEPDSPAGLNGTRVHALADVYVGQVLPAPSRDNLTLMPELQKVLASKKIPVEMERFKQEFQDLRRVRAITGKDWAFDRNWEVTSWFGAQAWLRIKVDVHYLEKIKNGKLTETHCHIIDYKTGRQQPEHDDQRSLYALGGFLTYPGIASVTASHWYLDAGHVERERWEASELNKLKKLWLKKTKAMLNDTTFAPNPSEQNCRWCHFSASKGGPCKY